MKRKTTRTTARWSERQQPPGRTSPYPATPPAPREPRRPIEQHGAGPYEANRDITFGYAQDRSILLP
jgi:hypothetical protein